MLKENLKKVTEQIAASCKKSKRDISDVRLVAVSKTKPVPMLQEIYNEGIRDFGENKVQELTEKYDLLPKDIRWHMIGHLQRNKVKYIVDKAYLIHSVDSLRLASTIEQEAAKKDCIVNILLEVNVSGEESKFGFHPDELEGAVREISKKRHIRVVGLMTIAPFVENAEKNRAIFRELHKLSVDINNKNIDNITMSILSMGMTNDYGIAIEEGANIVRVGTAIFGQRDYNASGDRV